MTAARRTPVAVPGSGLSDRVRWYDRIAPADRTAHPTAATPAGSAVSLPGGAHRVPRTHPGSLAARIDAYFPVPVDGRPGGAAAATAPRDRGAGTVPG